MRTVDHLILMVVICAAVFIVFMAIPSGTRMVRRLAADTVGMAVLALPLWTGPHPARLPRALSGSAGLRAPRERPRDRRAAQQRDELAPFHSITPSAIASSVGGNFAMHRHGMAIQDAPLAITEKISTVAALKPEGPSRPPLHRTKSVRQ
jgi:hypothetical protein